jgi:hypothetical protein
MAGHIFVSYVRDNSSVIDRLARDLSIRGAEVWIDRERLTPGQRWRDAIREAIGSGDLFLACFSSEYSSREKSYMNEELTFAIDQLRERPSDRMWFVPVLLSGTSIPDRRIGGGETLRDLQWVDLRENWQVGIESIAKAAFERRLLAARTGVIVPVSLPIGETVAEKAARITRERAEEEARVAFLNSHAAVRAALSEVEDLYARVKEMVTQFTVSESTFRIDVEIQQPSCAIRGAGYSVLLYWFYRYSNTLDDAALYIKEFERSYFLTGIQLIDSPRELRERKYQFDRRDGSYGWSSPDRQFRSTQQMAEHALDLLLTRADRRK